MYPSARPEETSSPPSARVQPASAIQPPASIGYGSKSRPSASVLSLFPWCSTRIQLNNGSTALSPPTLPEEQPWPVGLQISACVTTVLHSPKLRGTGVARLVSEGKGERGGNLVTSRSISGLGPPGPCHALAVPGEWFDHPIPDQKLAQARVAPVVSGSALGEYLKPLHWSPYS